MKLSNNTSKLITSLSQKKYRQKHHLFIAEGIKVVDELLKSSLKAVQVFTTDKQAITAPTDKVCLITEATLKKVSTLKTPNKVLGLFKIPIIAPPKKDVFTVVLDGINDPGNLGTIIRLCDWFGVSQLVCSKNTVDCYNQKVVQSSMGSLTRLQINYVDLEMFLQQSSLPIFIADMNGKNVYTSQLPKKAILVMGNEANGISETVKKIVANSLTIPRFGSLQQTESLNVATATAILLSEFRR